MPESKSGALGHFATPHSHTSFIAILWLSLPRLKLNPINGVEF